MKSSSMVVGCLAVFMTIGTGSAFAETSTSKKSQDMSTLTCGEFLEMDAPSATMTLFWYDGYLSQLSGEPVWDVETFVEHRDKLVEICSADDGKEKLVLESIQNLDS